MHLHKKKKIKKIRITYCELNIVENIKYRYLINALFINSAYIYAFYNL